MKMLAMVLLAAAPALAADAIDLEGDPAHSSAAFSVKHMMVTTVHGQFGKVNSSLHWNKDDPAKSSVEAKIDVSTINTNNDKRDGHLKSADFFDAGKCPQITFKSKKIEGSGEKYKVSGDLTMHCVTRPATLDVTFTPNPVKTPAGTTVYAANATTRLKRSEWGLNWNKALESGGVVVSDDVNIEADIEFVQKQADAKKEAQAETTKARQ